VLGKAEADDAKEELETKAKQFDNMQSMYKECTNRLTYINSQTSGGLDEEMTKLLKDTEEFKRDNETKTI
jgi:hypothetical protein